MPIGQSLIDRCERLTEEVVHLSSTWESWKAVFVADNADARRALLRRCVPSLATDLHWVWRGWVVLALGRLVDNGNDKLSFRTFLIRCRKADLPVGPLEIRFNALDKACKLIQRHRHEFIAHSSANIVGHRDLLPPPLTIADIDSAVALAGQALDEARRLVNLPESTKRLCDSDPAQELLHCAEALKLIAELRMPAYTENPEKTVAMLRNWYEDSGGMGPARKLIVCGTNPGLLRRGGA